MYWVVAFILVVTMFFISMLVYGTPILAIIIDKSRHDKDFKFNVFLMTGAFTIMVCLF